MHSRARRLVLIARHLRAEGVSLAKSAPSYSAAIGRAPRTQLQPRRRQPDATRARLLECATGLFASGGYEATHTEDIVRAAGLTRGALYHHFTDKEELFREVLVEVTAEAIVSVQARLPGGRCDAWEVASEGLLQYLDACLDPQRSRVLLVDGPQVFGLFALVQMADTSRAAVWEETLVQAMRNGLIDRLPVTALAHQLTAAVIEAGIYVVHSTDCDQARRDSRRVLRRMMEGLRPKS